MVKTAKHSAIDDRAYWKNRHEGEKSLRASGLKSANASANQYIYKILADQYLKLLKDLDIKEVKTILDCGFGDGYFLKFFSTNFPDTEVAGVDISQAAKNKIKFINKKQLHVGDLTSFNLQKQYDLVHCFDVLYHILGEDDYRKALVNIAGHSKKYVILHERFFKRTPLILQKHVRFRRREVTNQILNSQDFFLYKEIPTHFFAVRLFTSFLNKLFPATLYRVDNYLAQNAPDNVREALMSHSIRVYKRKLT